MTIIFWCIVIGHDSSHPRSSVVAAAEAHNKVAITGEQEKTVVYFPAAVCRTRARPGKRCAHRRIVSAGTA